jgi:hypothetical protein
MEPQRRELAGVYGQQRTKSSGSKVMCMGCRHMVEDRKSKMMRVFHDLKVMTTSHLLPERS